MEPIFGTLASESHSLSTINIPVVTQIEENEEISESHFAFYASKLLTFKYGGRNLTSSMFPLIFNKNNKKWCESVHSFVFWKPCPWHDAQKEEPYQGGVRRAGLFVVFVVFVVFGRLRDAQAYYI